MPCIAAQREARQSKDGDGETRPLFYWRLRLPKMPTKDSLSQPGSFRSGRALISAGQVDASAIGQGMKSAARGLEAIGDGLYRREEKEKRENDALDLIRAESAQRAALFETERAFDGDGDYGSHDRRFTPLATQETDRAASLIRDPKNREMWRLKAENDIIAGRQRLVDRADKMGRQERIVSLQNELEGYRNSFTDAKATSEDRARIIQQSRDAIELGKRSGMLDPMTASKFDDNYVRGAVKQDAERRVLEDPEGLRRELFGGRDVPMPLDEAENPETRAKPMAGDGKQGPTSLTDFARGKGRPENNAVPAAAPAVGPGREESGRFMVEGLDIKDRVDPNAQYGRSATAQAEPFTGIVLHHTGGDGADKFIKYGQSVDRERGGSFGYHFYVDKDGTIFQGAPMDARTNHVKPPSARERRDATGLANENAIGISLLGSGGDETPEQLAAVKQLADSLSGTYGIASNRIVGHGDLQHDRESREGQAALKAIRGEIRAGDLKTTSATGRYAMLSPLERAEFLKKAETAIRTKHEGEKTFVKQMLDDDVESVRRTGQGAELDLTDAKRVLQSDELHRYFLKRSEAELEHKGTSDLYKLPEEELQNRLSADRRIGGIKPASGEAFFEAKYRVYDKAEKKVNELRTLRETDPARAVDEFPEVTQASEAAQAAPDDPEALQNLARARLDAQGKVGIPDGLRTPITKAEAKVLAAPLRGVEGDRMEKAATDWYTGLQQRYGPYGRVVAEASIEYALTRDKDLAKLATGQIQSLANGVLPSASSIRRTEYLMEANRALGAYGGDFVGEPMRQYARISPRTASQQSPDDSLPGQAYLGDTNPNQIYFDETGGAHIEGRYIPPGAVKMLNDNPGLASQFNSHYGSGIAETILAGQMSPND